jgi:hypothetical protein
LLKAIASFAICPNPKTNIMIIHPLVRSSLALLGTASLATAATSLINVDFNVLGATGPSGTFNSTGVLGGGTWNGITGIRNFSSIAGTDLSTSTGASTGVDVTVATFNNGWDAGASSFIDSTKRALMSDYLYLYNAQSTATINISGLDASTTAWTLVLYGANGENSGSTFTYNAVSKTTTDTGTIGLNLVENDEYVTFTGTGNGPISITWDKVGTFSNFNGFQLQQVPEPSAALLGGLSLLALLRRRRA